MKKNLKFDAVEWALGDLVKISVSGADGRRAEALGLVSSLFHNEKQIKIFPSVSVYNMRTGTIEEHYVEDLELISESNA